MAVALGLLLLSLFNDLTGAAEPLAVRRPLVPSRRVLRTPGIPVAEDVHSVDVLLQDLHTRTNEARGIADIENIAYTQA
jgi:hypothetical protein